MTFEKFLELGDFLKTELKITAPQLHRARKHYCISYVSSITTDELSKIREFLGGVDLKVSWDEDGLIISWKREDIND